MFFLQNKGMSYFVLLGCVAAVCTTLLLIMASIFVQGAPAMNSSFFLESPRHGLTQGGILPAIVGTVMLTLLTAISALPVGIACAVYLNEYASDNLTTRWLRAAIRNLAGAPSIIYGLFGLALFVQQFRLGASMLAASFTLGLLTLPYMIATTEEALRTIPRSLREGAMALGATRFETIRDIVLPAALPGIATGVVLSLSRAAGETAPILFTGAAFYVTGVPGHPMQEFMALPYHLYTLSTQHQAIETVRPLAYATAATLILVVFALNLSAMLIRSAARK